MTEMKLQEDIYLSHVSQRLMERRENKLRADARVTEGEKPCTRVINKRICTKVEVSMIDPEESWFEFYAHSFSICQAELNVGFLYQDESQCCLIYCSMLCR